MGRKRKGEEPEDSDVEDGAEVAMVPQKLDADGISAKSSELAQLDIREMELRAAKTASANAYTAKIKEVNKRRNTLAHEIKTKVEMVPAQESLPLD